MSTEKDLKVYTDAFYANDVATMQKLQKQALKDSDLALAIILWHEAHGILIESDPDKALRKGKQ
jgi:hypothetical protein